MCKSARSFSVVFLTLAIVAGVLCGSLTAQLVKPKGFGSKAAAPAATPDKSEAAPAPKTDAKAADKKPAEAKEADKPAPKSDGKLVITTEFPASIESTRSKDVSLTAKGGKEPYTWSTESKMAEVIPADEPYVHLEAGEVDNFSFTLVVKDSSDPPLEAKKEVGIKVTPFVATLADVMNKIHNVNVDMNDLNNRQQWVMKYVQDNGLTKEEKGKLFNALLKQDNKLDKILFWLQLVGAAVVVLIVLVFLILIFRRSKSSSTSIFSKTSASSMGLLIIGVLLGCAAFAPPAQAAAPNKAPCRILGISPDAAVQDSEVVFTITHTCKDVESVEFAASGISVTEATLKAGGKLVTKVNLDANAEVGPALFQFKFKSGEPVESGKVVLTVFTKEVATGVDYSRTHNQDGAFNSYLIGEAQYLGLDVKLIRKLLSSPKKGSSQQAVEMIERARLTKLTQPQQVNGKVVSGAVLDTTTITNDIAGLRQQLATVSQEQASQRSEMTAIKVEQADQNTKIDLVGNFSSNIAADLLNKKGLVSQKGDENSDACRLYKQALEVQAYTNPKGRVLVILPAPPKGCDPTHSTTAR